MVRRKWTHEERKARSLLYTGKGNPFFGKTHTIKIKKLMSQSRLNKGLKENATLSAIHTWVKRRKIKPGLCEKCNINKPFDLANISGKYLRNVNDFKWLCRSCHSTFDKKILNIKWMKNLKPIDKNRVIELRQVGLSYGKIAKEMKICPQSAWNIVHGLWMDK